MGFALFITSDGLSNRNRWHGCVVIGSLMLALKIMMLIWSPTILANVLQPRSDMSSTLLLNGADGFYVVNQHLHVLTSSQPLDFSQASVSQEWHRWQSHRPFIQSQPFWMRLRVLSNESTEWLLKLSDANIDKMQLYVVKQGEMVQTQSSLRQESVFSAETSLDSTLSLELSANQLTDIYIHVSGHRQPFLQLEIWNENLLAGYQNHQMFTYGAFVGGCLLLMSILIAAGLVTRHSSIYVQLLYVLMILVAHLMSQGFIQRFLWPGSQAWMSLISFCLNGFVLALGLSLVRVMAFAYMSPLVTRLYYVAALIVVAGVTLLTFFNSLVLQQWFYFVGIANLSIGLITLLLLNVWQRMSFRFMMLGFVMGLLGYARHSGWVNSIADNSFERCNALTLGLMSHLLFVVCGSFIEVRQVLSTRLKEKLNAIELSHKQRLLDQQKTQHVLYDSLTGCPNRKALLRVLEDKVDQDPNGQFGLILIYLGHFKEINNTLGHHNGDELLKMIALRLNGVVSQFPGVINLAAQENKPSHLAALEGVVFGVLLESIEQGLLISISENVQQSLNQPFECQLMSLDITAFLGIACYPEHGRTSVDILQHAHVAIEIAQLRDQQVVFYSAELDPYSARRLTLVAELKHALRVGDLQLYYQPQVDLRLNEVIGVEALIRWRHRVHGFIPPQEFIPVAEKTGVIRQITAWVLDQAMQQAQRFYQQGLLMRVSINLSAKNLQEIELPSVVLTTLKQYAVPADSLCFEITETAMMMDPSRSMRNILALHECGIRLSIDDFGTGYSSLAYLKSLPVSEIKIDRSFVTEMRQEIDDQVIVRTTLNMSHNLGKEVVAEGIEDRETYQALVELGCDIGQGYFICRPLPADALMTWFDQSEYAVRKTYEKAPVFHLFNTVDPKRLS
jgi:predicted signal transduction protein with EAL and GGDEF domain